MKTLLKILSVGTTAILLGSAVTVGTSVPTASVAVAAMYYDTPSQRRIFVRARKHNVRVKVNGRRAARVARLKKARSGTKSRRADRVSRLKKVRKNKKSRR